MNLEKWQDICERAKFKLLPKRHTDQGNILLAERIVRDPADDARVWETMWAIERDGMDVGQVVRNPVVAEVNGFWRSTDTPRDQQDRIEEAVSAATRWIKDNRKVGRYT